jgi:hypothetical protein
MDFDFMDELQAELNVIAGNGTVVKPPNWRETKIGNWAGGFVKEAERIANPNWWEKPSNQAEQSLNDLLKRAGLGRLQDTDERENHGGEKGVSTNEIARRQRDRAQRRREGSAVDEEPWKKHLGSPKDDARQWLGALSKSIDVNRRDSKAFFDALKDHVTSQKHGARVSDLNASLVEFCLKNLCSE